MLRLNLPRLTKLPWRLPSLGIAARLSIACSAVLVLVVATTYFAGQSSRRAAQRVALIESLHEPTARLAQDMVDSAAGFNQTVLELANPDARRELGRLDAALNAMTAQADGYRKLHPGSTTLTAQYLSAVAAHELRARELLVLADQRRTSIQQYWRNFAALDRAVNTAETQLLRQANPDAPSGTTAKVVADRSSPLTLTQALGGLQDTFGAFASAGGKQTEQAVVRSEIDFRLALDRNQDTLSNTHDLSELAALRSKFEDVIRARRALVSLNGLIAGATERFHETSKRLNGFTDASVSRPARRALAGAAVDANTVASDINRTLWQLGLVTMSILLLICAATAYGVINPVRRLIAATRAITEGHRGSRVAVAGGVHELDTLAAAFNEMSNQLEQAETLVRHYQEKLEARVDERTQQLEYLAHHDPLTRLPNRRQLAQHLGTALETARRTHTRVGVLFMDLDNFKTINDTLGHEVGDGLLNCVGERLSLQTDGDAFIARLGGDEFTVIYRDVASVESVTALARAMIERFQPAFELNGRRLTIGVSIGAAVFPDHALDSAGLLRAADAALASAKESGRNRCSVYGPELLEAATTRFQIEQNLRQALDRGEFELFFQPVMSIDTQRLVTVEALLRWHAGDGSIIMPAQFIEIAERTGLITEISEWVLETAARQASKWRDSGWPDVRIAINVSSQQLLDATFHVRLEETLAKYALPAHCIEIELTETALQTGATTIAALHWMRALGVGIALDDFGTGFSSLTSLQQLPLSRVKLDRSLIHDVDTNPRSASIVRSIIGLCRSLDLSITVEGVERRAQLALLRAQGPVNAQGYLLSQALPIADIKEFIAQREGALRDLFAGMPVIRDDASISDTMIVRQLRVIET